MRSAREKYRTATLRRGPPARISLARRSIGQSNSRRRSASGDCGFGHSRRINDAFVSSRDDRGGNSALQSYRAWLALRIGLLRSQDAPRHSESLVQGRRVARIEHVRIVFGRFGHRQLLSLRKAGARRSLSQPSEPKSETDDGIIIAWQAQIDESILPAPAPHVRRLRQKRLARIASLSKCGGEDRLRTGTDEIFLKDNAFVRLPLAFDPVLKRIAKWGQPCLDHAGTRGFRGRPPMRAHGDRFSNHIKMLGHHSFAAREAHSVDFPPVANRQRGTAAHFRRRGLRNEPTSPLTLEQPAPARSFPIDPARSRSWRRSWLMARPPAAAGGHPPGRKRPAVHVLFERLMGEGCASRSGAFGS